MSASLHDDATFLRQELAQCSTLLKCSLKSNRPFDSNTRMKISDTLSRLNESIDSHHEFKERQASNFDKVSQRANELEQLVQKQDDLSAFLRSQLEQLQKENSELKKLKDEELATLRQASVDANSHLSQLEKDLSKIREERDTSRDQNKKLVELLQRMEKKLSESSQKQEELEEENLNLRDVTKLMSAQIDKIEKEFERKMAEKDGKIQDLKKRLQTNETQTQRELDLNQDLEDLENMESQLFKKSS